MGAMGSVYQLYTCRTFGNHNEKSDAFIPLNGSGRSLTAGDVIAYFPFI